MTNNDELSSKLSLKEIKASGSLSEEEYQNLETKMFEIWLEKEIDKWYAKKKAKQKRRYFP